MGPPAADAAAPAGNPDDMWKGYRYVDETGKPLATAAEVDGSPLEFNLMPFRMRLTINPKDIDEFLIACRNSVLPIEVREIDLLEGAGSTSAPASPTMMPPRGGGGMRHGEGDEFGPRGGGGYAPPAMMPQGGGVPGVPQQKTVQIEVAGVVYLIKTPDPTKLGPPPEGGAPADGAAPATPAENVTAPTPMPPAAAAPEKSEIRIATRRGEAKYEANRKDEIQNGCVFVLNFPGLEFVSRFGFRISDFASPLSDGLRCV
jgi:hypothetical protein